MPRRKKARKPHILKHKVELANLIKQKWTKKWYDEHEPTNGYYYWRGDFYSENGIHIYVYLQRYTSRRRRGSVDFVQMRFNGVDGRALYPTEIKDLITQINEAQ